MTALLSAFVCISYFNRLLTPSYRGDAKNKILRATKMYFLHNSITAQNVWQNDSFSHNYTKLMVAVVTVTAKSPVGSEVLKFLLQTEYPVSRSSFSLTSSWPQWFKCSDSCAGTPGML